LIAEDAPRRPIPQAEPDQRDDFGFADPDAAALRIAGWSEGGFRALRSEAAKAAFDAIRPQLFAALGQGPDPDHALARFETLLEKLPSAINLFRLLEARPGLLQQLVDCLTLAAPLADELARRPELLDTLIDRTAFDLPGSTEDLARMMRRTERGDEYEQALDRIRIVTSEQRFTLGVQLIEAAQDPLDVAEALSRVAEAAVQVACEAAQEEFAERHGRFADGELLVLGLGRLGGGALTHASDLDMIYLFTDGETAESDGARPLGRTLYFNRLAQRVGVALSVPTAQGALYDVDTRLRPQGNQGPLAVSLSSFERYQRENAWTWEHMALNRARVLVGSNDARQQVGAIVDAILNRQRDPLELRADVVTMRSDMAAHKPARGELDVKLLRGGLVDLEFLIHFPAIARTHRAQPRSLGRDCRTDRAGAGLTRASRASSPAHEGAGRLAAVGARSGRTRPCRAGGAGAAGAGGGLRFALAGTGPGAPWGGGTMGRDLRRETGAESMSEFPAQGDAMPDIALETPEGGSVRASDFAGRKAVFFFYPKDNTPGCTTEAKDFSALKPEFEKAGVALLGISKDSAQKASQFHRQARAHRRSRDRCRGGRIVRRSGHLGGEVDVRQDLYGDGPDDLSGRRRR
jgi:hypothetical protein